MNERIQELAVKAKLMAEEDINRQLSYNAELKAFAEKFAELIVRECMNICAEREEDIRTRIRDEGKAATAYMCRAYIKEHFGVGE